MLLVAGLAFSGYRAVDFNFVHYDDETYPYVFVHTTREALAMVDAVHELSAR